jgi:hypothetical protein
MVDNENTSEKVQVDGSEQISGQEQEVSSSNSQNEALSSPRGDDPAESVSTSTSMAILCVVCTSLLSEVWLN